LRVIDVRLRVDVDIQLKILNKTEEVVDIREFVLAFGDSNGKQRTGVTSVFEVLKDGGGQVSQTLPGGVRELLIVLQVLLV
jgi:hypothetical protein